MPSPDSVKVLIHPLSSLARTCLLSVGLSDVKKLRQLGSFSLQLLLCLKNIALTCGPVPVGAIMVEVTVGYGTMPELACLHSRLR
jgi:hypothetical protein